MTNGAGTTSYAYDADNELLSVADTVTNGGYVADQPVTYKRADGNRTQMVDESGTTSYTYDGLERLVSSTDGAGNTVTYGYDLNGDVTCLSYPNSAANTCKTIGTGIGIVTYSYEAAGQATSMTDWLGNTTDFSYDHDSNVTSTMLPSGTNATVTTAFDNADNLNSVSVTAGGTPTTLVNLTRNADENIAANSAGSGTSYGYDSLNHVTSAGANSYTYDAAGELTSTASAVGTSDYSYNTDGQLCWIGSSAGTCASAPSGSTNYTYDSVGERTAITPSSGEPTTYGWDQAGTLTCETTANNSGYNCTNPNSAASSTYTYNGDGLRISDTPASANTQEFTWDTLSSTPQLLMDGTNFYLYGPNVGTAPIEQISVSGSIPTYLVSDNTGVREQLSSIGGVEGTNSYDAYGNCSSCTSSTPFGFAGAYTDATGLSYLINRYYDPTTGQFISVDPLVTITGLPFAYANDNPINDTDSLGLWGWNPISDFTQATNDVGGAVASGVTWVAHHPLETAGIVIGAVSLCYRSRRNRWRNFSYWRSDSRSYWIGGSFICFWCDWNGH